VECLAVIPAGGLVNEWRQAADKGSMNLQYYFKQRLYEFIPRWSSAFKSDLTRLRLQAKEDRDSGEPINVLQEKLTIGYHNVLRKMLDQAIELVGSPTCNYALYGLGSFARGEVLPYSDVEYLWLFRERDANTRQIFLLLHEAISLQIKTVDEPGGFHPDQYPEITEKYCIKVNSGLESVYMPKCLDEIAEGFYANCRSGIQNFTQILALLQGRFIAGDNSMWTTYLNRIAQMFAEGNSGSTGKRVTVRSLPRIARDIIFSVSETQFRNTWQGCDSLSSGFSHTHDQLNLKTGFSFFLTYLCMMLRALFNIEKTSTIEVLGELEERDIVASSTVEKLIWAWQIVQTLRFDCHLFYSDGMQYFALDPGDTKIYIITPETKSQLNEILSFLRLFYTNLNAIKEIERSAKSTKAALQKGGNIQAFVKKLEENLENFRAFPCLIPPDIDLTLGHMTLINYIQQPSDGNLISLLLYCGVPASDPDALGRVPARHVLSWSEISPKQASIVWSHLFRAGSDPEQRDETFPHTLLEETVKNNFPESFIALCSLGAGRSSEPEILHSFIDSYVNPRHENVDTEMRPAMMKVITLLAQQNSRFAWKLALRGLIQDTPPSDMAIAVEGAVSGRGYLSPVATSQIFSPSGKIIKMNQYGRHIVSKIKINKQAIYVKFFPELPGVEEAIRMLAVQLFGGCTAQSELFRFQDRDGQIYSILMSQEVPGQNLHEVLMNRRDDFLMKLDSYRFTQLFFLSLLVNPEDGKPDNYILSPYISKDCKASYQIICIDNDHSFVPPIVKEKGARKIQVKTIVYCLEQARHLLHPKAIQEFLKLPPERELTSWLEKLNYRQLRYEQLFPYKERQSLLDTESVTQIPFPRGSMAELYCRWRRMQEVLENTPNISGLDLLIRVEPILGIQYKSMFDRWPSAMERFHGIASGSYDQGLLAVGQYKTLITSRQILRSRNIPEKELIEGSKSLGPIRAKQELVEIISEDVTCAYVLQQLKTGNVLALGELLLPQSWTTVMKQIDWTVLLPVKQQQLLGILSQRPLEEVILTNCGELTNAILTQILVASPSLMTLKIEGAPKLGAGWVSLVEKNAKCLENLTILNMPSLVTLKLQLLELKALHLQCSSLKEFSLEAPKLSMVVLENMHALTTLDISFPEKIKLLKLTNIPLLTTSKLNPIISQSFALKPKSFHLANCPNIEKEEIDAQLTKNKAASGILLSGEECLMVGDYSNAISVFNDMLEQDPYNTVALLGKSCALYAFGNFEEAFGCYNFALSTSQKQNLELLWEVQIQNVNTRHIATRHQKDINCLNLVVSYMLGLTRFYELTKQEAKANSLFSRVTSLVGHARAAGIGKVLSLSQIGDFYFFEKKNSDDALRNYNSALKRLNAISTQHSLLFPLHKKIAAVFLEKGDTVSATKAFKIALRIPVVDVEKNHLSVLRKLIKITQKSNTISDLLSYCEQTVELLLKLRDRWKKYDCSSVLEEYMKNSFSLDDHRRVIRMLTELAKNKPKSDALSTIRTLGTKFPQHPTISLLYQKVALQLYGEGDELPCVTLAEIWKQLGDSYIALGKFAKATTHLKKWLTFYSEKWPGERLNQYVDVLSKLGDCYLVCKQTGDAISYYLTAIETLKELVTISGVPPLTMTEMNLKNFGDALGLSFNLDENNTCIIGIDDAYSVHLTFEPNSKRLYLYSPLLDGFPEDLGSLMLLYEALLTGSMLGAKFSGGGCGVASKEQLVLAHVTLEMADADPYTLVESMSGWTALVEYWREQLKYVLKGEPMTEPPKLSKPIGNYAVHKLAELLEKYNQIVDSPIQTPSHLALSWAKDQLKTFGEELNLMSLEFDENNTCILGIDDTFSLHLTYEPNSYRLYIYSPLLDGLPKDTSQKLGLYEALLEGAMLGGQMAGGGCGVAVAEELILMHCCIQTNPYQPNKNALRAFAPLYVETIEKWRAKCTSRFSVVPRRASKVPLTANLKLSLWQRFLTSSFVSFFLPDSFLQDVIQSVANGPQNQVKTVDMKERLTEKFSKQAKAFSEMQYYGKAIELCDYVLVFHPNDFDMLLLKATCFKNRGRVAEAIKTLGHLLQQNPKHESALFEMGTLLFSMNQVLAAKNYFLKVLEVNPNAASAYWGLGWVSRQSRDHAESRAHFLKCCELAPHFIAAAVQVVYTLMDEGNIREAEASVEKLFAEHPTDTDVLTLAIQISKVTGQMEKGISYAKILSENAYTTHNLRALALAYEEAGQWDEAMACYDRALTLPPSNEMLFIMYNKAQLLLALGQYEEAYMYCEKAELFPYTSEVFPYYEMVKAAYYAKKGDAAKALACGLPCLSKAETLENKTWSKNYFAEQLMDLEKYSEALELVNESLRLKPADNYYAQATKAIILAFMDNRKELDVMLPIIFSVNPRHRYALYARGIQEGNEGKYEQALETLQTALEVFPLFYFALAHQGYIYKLMGDYDKALDCLDRALSINKHYLPALKWRHEMRVNDEDPETNSEHSTNDVTFDVADEKSREDEDEEENNEIEEEKEGVKEIDQPPNADYIPLQTQVGNLNSIFPPQFSYLPLFRTLRSEVLSVIREEKEGAIEDVVPTWMSNFTLVLQREIFLEALEYGKVKIFSTEEPIRDIQKRLLIRQGALTFGKEGRKWDDNIVAIVSHYQEFLKDLNSTCDISEKALIQRESDHCLVLITGVKQFMKLGASFNERNFFREINEQQVYRETGIPPFDPKLLFLSGKLFASLRNSLGSIWGTIFDAIMVRLPFNSLDSTRRQLETQLQKELNRYKLIKECFKMYLGTQSKYWKGQWLYQRDLPVWKFGGNKGNTVSGNFHLNQQLSLDRFVIYTFPNCFAMLGSSYFSTDKPQSIEKTLCLDTNFQVGDCGATSDGYGHFASLELNKVVHMTAYRTVKLATRYCQLYSEPALLYENIPVLFPCIGSAIKQSFLHPEEAGTASVVITKVFPDPDRDGNKIIVAAGVGDGMVLAYTPSSGSLVTLIKPRQYNRGFQFTPISVTEKYTPSVIQRCIVSVPKDTIILRMTDGAWELLPLKDRVKEMDSDFKRHYYESEVDTKVLSPQLLQFKQEHTEITVSEYGEFLRHLMTKTLLERKEKIWAYTQELPKFISTYKTVNTGTVSQFVDWLSVYDTQFFSLWQQCLEYLHYDWNAIKDFDTEEFLKSLEKANIGDDVTLYVEK
jgi:tetratricopeptide (TPR) repeat protein